MIREFLVKIDGLSLDPHPVFNPQIMQTTQNRHKSWPLSLILWWKIGSAIKRLQVWREEHIQRPPSSLPEHGLKAGHVNLVHIWALFPVQLDADEMFIEEIRDLLALERFPFHHMTPVTRRIPDTQKDQFFLLPGLCERLLAPGIPIHRVESMLEKVGRLGLNQAVWR